MYPISSELDLKYGVRGVAFPKCFIFFFNCDATWPIGLILNNVSRCGTISIEFYPFGI